MTAELPPVHPGVRTTRRRGRTSATKVAALRDLGPRWMVPSDGPWTPDALRARTGADADAPLLLDIGVGDGRASIAWAEAHPDAVVVALELHRPGLAALLTRLDADGPTNVVVSEVDALRVLDELPSASLAAVRVLFPDPWPKRRHVARRLVDRAFVDRVAEVLEPDGTLEVATDWDEYAEHVRTMAATQPRLAADHPSARPPRPETTYERRGLAAGRRIHDLRYRRTAG